jgi:DNA-binding response OmpR family regulator
MTRILSIDASPQTRASIAEVVKGMSFDFDEAEDGEAGLERLRAGGYDLVIMEAKLPTLEGVEVLERMRVLHDNTPVLVLTEIAKRTVVASMMKLGISDYMLKPFEGTDLATKITKALTTPQQRAASAAALAGAAAGGSPASKSSKPAAAATPSVDILIIDDIDNVHKKLKSMLPAKMTTASALDAAAAMAEARAHLFRVIIIDVELPEVTEGHLLAQLRVLQPQAAWIALALRSTTSGTKKDGFDGVMHKPFTAGEVDELMQTYFDNQQELVTHEEFCVKIGGFTGSENRLEKYFDRVGELANTAFEQIAAACYDQTIVDLTHLPHRPDRIPKFIQALNSSSTKLGLALRLVGSNELKTLLASFDETNTVVVCTSLEEARSKTAEPPA